MSIAISDIVVIAIFVLTVLICTVRGLGMTLYSLFSIVIAVVAAYLLRPFVSTFFINIGAASIFEDGIYANIDAARLAQLPQSASLSGQQIAESMKLPGFIQNFLAANMQSWNAQGAIETVERQMAMAVSNLLVNVLSVVVIIILVIIALMIIKRVIKAINKIPVLKTVNRVGGFLIGIVLAYFIITGAALVLNLFSGAAWYPAVYADITGSLIAKYFFSTNVFMLLLSKFKV